MLDLINVSFGSSFTFHDWFDVEDGDINGKLYIKTDQGLCFISPIRIKQVPKSYSLEGDIIGSGSIEGLVVKLEDGNVLKIDVNYSSVSTGDHIVCMDIII